MQVNGFVSALTCMTLYFWVATAAYAHWGERLDLRRHFMEAATQSPRYFEPRDNFGSHFCFIDAFKACNQLCQKVRAFSPATWQLQVLAWHGAA